MYPHKQIVSPYMVEIVFINVEIWFTYKKRKLFPLKHNKLCYNRYMELIYHKPGENGKRSPFDEAVEKVVSKENLKIACPYIGLSYFIETIKNQCKDFCLITDINELISCQRNKDDVNAAVDFLIQNRKNIRHYSGLHAKVIISANKAFFGSSNLTASGIKNNNELSVIIDEKEKIDELNNWFESWWNIAADIDPEELKSNTQEYLKKQRVTPHRTSILKNNNTIKSSIKQYTKSEKVNLPIDEDFLKKIIINWPNKDFLLSYCKLVQHILKRFDITKEDERICISCYNGKYQIAVTFGQRYIIYPRDRDDSTIDLIMPKDFDVSNAEKECSFDVTYFTKNKENDIPWVHYHKGEGAFSFNDKTIQEWESAVEHELARCKKGSSYHAYHQPLLYTFFMDDDFRNRIFHEVGI